MESNGHGLKYLIGLNISSVILCLILKFKEQMKIWEGKGLKIFFLPPYSPQLNPIEQLWKFMKYYWIELDAYKSSEKMKNYVEKVIIGYGNEYEIIFD